MSKYRLQKEIEILNEKIPDAMDTKGNVMKAFVFYGMESSDPHVVMGARTNANHEYTIYIELKNFPLGVPNIYIEKDLKDFKGESLCKTSGSMHTLQSDRDGWVKICHCSSENWKPATSLYLLYVKALLWLNAYDAHIMTGKPIDAVLSHQ